MRASEVYHSGMIIDLQALALEGARLRVHELLEELAIIRRAFPSISSDRPARRLGSSAARRRRRPMTAAERKAVGIRMKAYWASRRKAAAE